WYDLALLGQVIVSLGLAAGAAKTKVTDSHANSSLASWRRRRSSAAVRLLLCRLRVVEPFGRRGGAAQIDERGRRAGHRDPTLAFRSKRATDLLHGPASGAQHRQLRG